MLNLTHSWLDKEQATDDNKTYNGMGSVADWKVFGHRSERKAILYSASKRTCAWCSPHTPYTIF